MLIVLPLVVQARSSQPLSPLWLLRDRSRWGSYLGMLLLAVGPMGRFYLMPL